MSFPEAVRLTSSDGVSLTGNYYGSVSDGPSYVLGHGFTGSASHPRVVPLAEHLAGRGASVLVIDFRGHAGSGGGSTVGVGEVNDLAAAVTWLRTRRPGSPVITLGFSMGASVVVRHAGLGGAGIDAAVAVSGPGRWYERGTEPMRRLHRGLETRIGRTILRWVFKIRIGDGWDLLPVSPVEVIGAVSVPLLVVHGDDDPYFGLEHPRMLFGAGATAQPPVELWLEAGMGHAESATSPQLLDRIDEWGRAAVGVWEHGSVTEHPKARPATAESQPIPAAAKSRPAPPAEPQPASAAARPKPAGGAAQIHLVVVAVLASALLLVGSAGGTAGLVAAVAVVQAVLVLAWVLGTGLPGRIGALIMGGLAAAGADAALVHWHSHGYDPVLGVIGVAMPVMFVHQLTRGVVRTRVVESLADITIVLIAVTAVSGLVVLRYQPAGDQMVLAVVGAIGSGLALSSLVDALVPKPRFDPQVDRGLPGLLAGVIVGGLVGVLCLRNVTDFSTGRAAFAGAVSAAVACLVSIGASFVWVHSTLTVGQRSEPALVPAGMRGPAADDDLGIWPGVPRLRPVAAVLVALALSVPAGYVLITALTN